MEVALIRGNYFSVKQTIYHYKNVDHVSPYSITFKKNNKKWVFHKKGFALLWAGETVNV